MKIKTAVIPVAGKGTRFLPATKETPKEMIPVLNFPMVHYVVKEAVDAGIERIVFVTSSGKEAITRYFDRNIALEQFLQENGKNDQVEMIKSIGEMIEITTVQQKQQLGLGHAVLCAEKVVDEDHFAVILGDDLIFGDNPVTGQLQQISSKFQASSVIGVMEVEPSTTNKYGIVDGTFDANDSKVLKMKQMVEKPSPDKAPTNLATPGRYILSRKIFQILREIPRGHGGEYQLTDAINELCKQEDVYAYIFEGKRYDTGTLPGYLRAVVELALQRDDLKETMREIIRDNQ